jgi:hypothetical protein
MASVGIVLLVRSRMRRLGKLAPLRVRDRGPREEPARPWQRVAFGALLLFCLTIPSNWTQDVPAHYGRRHEGLRHSWLYPAIDTAPAESAAEP